jgi:hypothetical protein
MEMLSRSEWTGPVFAYIKNIPGSGEMSSGSSLVITHISIGLQSASTVVQPLYVILRRDNLWGKPSKR